MEYHKILLDKQARQYTQSLDMKRKIMGHEE